MPATKGWISAFGIRRRNRTALTTGVEWNLTVERSEDWLLLGKVFEDLLSSPRVKPLTQDWIDDYAARRRQRPLPEIAKAIVEDDSPLVPPAPHAIQRESLAALGRSRAQGARGEIVELATGLGKSWLASFVSIDHEKRSFSRLSKRWAGLTIQDDLIPKNSTIS